MTGSPIDANFSWPRPAIQQYILGAIKINGTGEEGQDAWVAHVVDRVMRWGSFFPTKSNKTADFDPERSLHPINGKVANTLPILAAVPVIVNISPLNSLENTYSCFFLRLSSSPVPLPRTFSALRPRPSSVYAALREYR